MHGIFHPFSSLQQSVILSLGKMINNSAALPVFTVGVPSTKACRCGVVNTAVVKIFFLHTASCVGVHIVS